MLKIASLTVTQNGVRDPGQVAGMAEFAASGGLFTEDAMARFAGGAGGRLMRVASIDGGRTLLLCDGLHRAVAKHYAGVGFLEDSEVVVMPLRLRDFTEANLALGWYTPFDPATEVRLPDSGGFRRAVADLIGAGFGWQLVRQVIDANRHLYAEPRRFRQVSEVAASLLSDAGACR